MLSHTRMGVPYEYTHMGRPIRVWDNIRIWGRTSQLKAGVYYYPERYGTERLIPLNTYFTERFQNML